MTGTAARRRYQERRRQKRRVGYATEAEFLAARDVFREAARGQRVCQNPDCPHPSARRWMAHHVVYEQELRRLGLPIWDARNSMRLCDECHADHHHGKPMPQTILSPAHVEYAREVLGDAYIDYFNRRYVPECPI